jgi:hypothetical protein
MVESGVRRERRGAIGCSIVEDKPLPETLCSLVLFFRVVPLPQLIFDPAKRHVGSGSDDAEFREGIAPRHVAGTGRVARRLRWLRNLGTINAAAACGISYRCVTAKLSLFRISVLSIDLTNFSNSLSSSSAKITPGISLITTCFGVIASIWRFTLAVWLHPFGHFQYSDCTSTNDSSSELAKGCHLCLQASHSRKGFHPIMVTPTFLSSLSRRRLFMAAPVQ